MILYLFLIFGFLGITLPPENISNLFLACTPLVMLVTAWYLIEGSFKNKGLIRYLRFVVIVSFVIEALGVALGLFFGSYVYGSRLGPTLFGTPLIIGVNWFIVMLGVGSFLYEKVNNHNVTIQALKGAILAVLFDFVLEPFAIMLDFWSWEQGSVPIHNYVGWFVLSFFLLYFLFKAKDRYTYNLTRARSVIISYFLFIVAIRIFY